MELLSHTIRFRLNLDWARHMACSKDLPLTVWKWNNINVLMCYGRMELKSRAGVRVGEMSSSQREHLTLGLLDARQVYQPAVVLFVVFDVMTALANY